MIGSGPTEERPPIDPLLAAIFTKMATDSASTNNAIEENLRGQIAEWQRSFRLLYNSMKKVYDRTDSATARHALEWFEYEYELADNAKRGESN